MASKNLFRALLDLLPSPPLLVGDVVAYADGVATIELPGGGLQQARGTATIGDRVFFRNDVIEGPAPTLSIELIDV
jgi:hypothetical protein